MNNTPSIAWHGPDRERPTTFKVIVKSGSVVQHHTRLTEAEYTALLAAPSVTRPNVAPALAAGADLLAQVMAS